MKTSIMKLIQKLINPFQIILQEQYFHFEHSTYTTNSDDGYDIPDNFVPYYSQYRAPQYRYSRLRASQLRASQFRALI